jgi:signal transduction histidine kinase
VEEQLQELNRKFRARIGQGTAALTQANGDLADGKFPNQVAKAQMADIGELAASIAHDFNNILSIVQAYAALIVSSPTKPKDVIEHAEVIDQGNRREGRDAGTTVSRTWPKDGNGAGVCKYQRFAAPDGQVTHARGMRCQRAAIFFC